MLASWQNILFCFHKLLATHLKTFPPSIKVGISVSCENRKAIHVMLSARRASYIQPLVSQKLSEYRIRITNTQMKMTRNKFPFIISPIHAVIEAQFSTITMGGQDNGGKYEFEFCSRPPLFQFHYDLINGKYSPM